MLKKIFKKRKNPLSEESMVKNPIARLGYGIVAYLDILWCLMWTFALYSIFLIPTFTFFGTGSSYANVPEAIDTIYLHTFIGSLGYSSAQCASIPYEVGTLPMTCPTGYIGKITDYGLNTSRRYKYDCKTNQWNKDCRPDHPDVEAGLQAAIDQPWFAFDFSSL